MNTKKKLRTLRDAWADCTKCGLAQGRCGHPILFGAGPANADFLVLIEAPSKEDTEDGVLLSADAGRLVEDLLTEAGIDPVSNTFRTSLVGCRPTVTLPATEDMPEITQDRGPNKAEVTACLPRVHEIIYLVDPYIIIAMGDAPWKVLVPTKGRGSANTIASSAGELYETRIPGRRRMIRYPVLATLSPAHLIANPGSSQTGPIATTLAAFIKATKYVSAVKKEENA